MPTITGVSHVDLSVRNLDSAETWYRGLFDAALVLSGRNEVLGFDYRYLLVPGAELLIGLIRHDHAKDGFDHERPGLDHLSLEVADRDTLEQWLIHLDKLGVDHSGIVEQPTGDALPLRGPDELQLEFYVPSPDLPWIQGRVAR